VVTKSAVTPVKNSLRMKLVTLLFFLPSLKIDKKDKYFLKCPHSISKKRVFQNEK